MATPSTPTPQELQKLVDLFKSVEGYTDRTAKDMADIVVSAGNWQKKTAALERDFYSMGDSFSSMARSLKDSIQEFQKMDTHAASTKKSFGALQSISSKLASDQSGFSRLSEKELKTLKQKVALESTSIANNIKSLSGGQKQEAIEVLSQTKKLTELVEERLDREKEVTKAVGLTGNALTLLNKLPGIAGALKTEEALEEMKDLADKMKDEGKNINSFGNKLKIAGVGFKKAFSGLKESLTDPVAILTFIVTQALKANTQVVEMGKSLGKDSSTYRENIASIARNSTNINMTTANLVESYSELVKATGLAYEYNEDQLTTQTKLTKQVGLTAEEASNIARLGILNNKTSESTYNSFVKGLVASRNQLKVGIDFKATLAEAANVSGQLAANLGYNPERIAKAVVTAKAFGMTLEQVAKAGDSLLNFESSLENELKAELLTGKQLNLERARAAALSGDQVTLAEELAKNVGTSAEFSKMNVLQQRSLAEAVGMTADELGNTLKKREEALKSGKSLAQVNEEEAKKALERQSIQDKFNASILKLQDFFGNLMAGPVGQLLDVITTIVGLISDVLQPILNVVFTPIRWAAQLLEKMGGSLKYLVGLAIIYKGVQLGINIAKQTQFGLDVASMMKEEGSLGFKTASALVEKESLATKIATYAVTGGMLVYEKAKQAVLFVQEGIEGAILAIKESSLLLTIREAWKSIAGAAASAYESAAKIPYVGWLLGGVAAAGAIALGASLMSKGDDVMSSPGYGNRVLSTGEGSIALNNKDTVVAGTDLFGGGGNKAGGESIQGPSIDLTPMIIAINAVKASVDRLYHKDQSVHMDGKKVGTTLSQGSHKVA